jgi:hypothetical protein
MLVAAKSSIAMAAVMPKHHVAHGSHVSTKDSELITPPAAAQGTHCRTRSGTVCQLDMANPEDLGLYWFTSISMKAMAAVPQHHVAHGSHVSTTDSELVTPPATT